MTNPSTTPSTLPDFNSSIISHNGNEFFHITTTLSSFQKNSGNGLILYFYPKDSTAGCTTQAQDFSQNIDRFNTLGYDVIGVSRDGIASHERFITNKDLKIPLISDKEEQLCQYFGVIGEKMMYGKKVLGVVRSTFVFDKDGKLQHEYRNVRAKGHVEKVLADLQNNLQ